jgi:hypothetical protein
VNAWIGPWQIDFAVYKIEIPIWINEGVQKRLGLLFIQISARGTLLTDSMQPLIQLPWPFPSLIVLFSIFYFFLDSRKPYPPESVFYRHRWASKTPNVPGSYKRCTPWLELETCCADLKRFAITLRPLKTLFSNIAQETTIYIYIYIIEDCNFRAWKI